MRSLERFKESDIRALGGLSEEDRQLRGVEELLDLAIPATKKFREAIGVGHGARNWLRSAKAGCRMLREANSEAALGFLVRKGVQAIANDWYRVAPSTWKEYCEVVGSSSVAEWYAPLYPSTIAGEVDRGGRFPEGRIVGEDSLIVNRKFGLTESIERELFDDDQTGQIKQRAQHLGVGMNVTESVYAASRFIGTARTYSNLTVAASGYTTQDVNGNTVTGPWSTTIYGTSGNRPSTYAALNIGGIKTALAALMNATDPLQNKIVTTPNCLLVSSHDTVNAALLLAPGPYPGVVGQSSGGDAPAAYGGTDPAGGSANQGVLSGFPGGVMSPNPFAGMGLKVTRERYLDDWAWALGESNKGFVFQERDPLEITQEAPTSGSYFTFDVIKLRSRRRFEVDWVGGGSRFWYLGNIGSNGSGGATGNQ